MKSLLALVIAILALSAAVPSNAAYETGGVVKMMLSNGVTLLVKPEPESKVAAVEIFVRVGAQDEREGSAGIGQILAGSVLAGSTTRSRVRLSRLAAEAGGNFHSVWQWNYIETYAVTLPSAYGEAISLLADAIQNSSLDAVAIERSRSTIMREMGRQQDDPFNSALTLLRRSMYEGMPYGRSYLGDPDDVKSISVQQVKDFYQRNFTSDRIVVSVVGNVNPEAVARRVEICLRNMKQGSSASRKVQPVSVVTREIVGQSSGKATYVMVGYPAPGIEDKSYPAMCVANVLLGGNKSSLLFTKLREEKGLGYLVGSQITSMSGSSSIAAYLGMDANRATPEVVKTVKSTIIDQVSTLQGGGFTDRDLERAKRYLIGKHALGRERTRDRAFNIGFSEILGLGYQSDIPACYADVVNGVTREDVIGVCNRYLSRPTMLVYSGTN
ncbi:MAG TPA: pitrilysin family protein [Armatimonadota bacterium]|jgi:predicted Zn-dependent peptidase